MATAHGQCSGRRLDDNAGIALRQLAADKSERAFGEGRHQRASAARGVVDEFIDDEARARADREGRAVEQQHLHHAGGRSVDALVIDDRFADLEGGGFAAGRLAGQA
jgi:hypothetical protein